MVKAQIILTSCSRRSLEIEQLKSYLSGNGYSLVADEWNVDPDAELILLSTCGFTKTAEDFGFSTLRRIQSTKKPDARVIFGGCIPKINPERVAQEFDGPTFSPQSYAELDHILGTRYKFDEFQRPNTFSSPQSSLITDARKVVEILKTYDGSISGIGYISRRLSNAARRKWIRNRYANLYSPDTFYIQIQEGCSMHCSYCVIREAIGPLRSRSVDAVLAEFIKGLGEGYRHVQLMGDNAGSYGLDLGINMDRLLERILAIEGDFVIDLTDINPVYLPIIYESAKKLAVQGKLSSLYVPIQSANPRLLRLMNRECDMSRMEQMLIEIKQCSPPKFKLGTSLIVGFPSETIDDLEETINFCQRAGFDWVWCHNFSARPETPAAVLPDPISAEEIHRRVRWVRSRLGRKSMVTTADDSAGSKTCQG